MKDFFNTKSWQLVLIWVIVIFIVSVNADSYEPTPWLAIMIPIMLIHTLGWLGYRNTK